MGATKGWVMDALESRRDEWIRARLSSPDLEDDSEEWYLLGQDYDSYQDYLAVEAQFQDEEQQWLAENPHTTIYDTAISLLKEIQGEGKANASEIFIKMQIAYCVTILESCLCEMIKSVVLSHERYMVNAVRNIKELKDKAIPLTDLLENKGNTADKYVQEYLSSLLYHNITKVFEVYQAILQPGKRISINMGDVIKLTKLRHDIVHRNGKTVDGNDIPFKQGNLEKSIATVRVFLGDMKKIISDAIEKHDNDKVNDMPEDF
ncbi:HEPN domain-containing protein [Serratia fonticola]|uniref:RiboL-PSP-HEPN domain-containing protein n=1 Tax=Serratia fonticola TaxID=47917 RepID=A0A448SSV6_SERFO|nr:Uncharacterised protein [Serratia fonticola]